MQTEMQGTTPPTTTTADPAQGQFLQEFDAEIPVEGAMGRAPVTGDPAGMDDTQVTPEEQAQYDEFTTMALGIVHGLEKVGPNRASADVVLDYFKPSGTTVPQALGFATAEVCYTVHQYMKRQKIEIGADVIFHSAAEVMSEIYEFAAAAKVIPVAKLPPAGSPQEEQLLGKALMYAVERFGQRLEATGQLPREEANQHLNEQIRREGESGELDDYDPRADMDADGMNHALKKIRKNGQGEDAVGEFAAKGYPRMVDPNEAAQPAPGG